jgi:hypothetical protein
MAPLSDRISATAGRAGVAQKLQAKGVGGGVDPEPRLIERRARFPATGRKEGLLPLKTPPSSVVTRWAANVFSGPDLVRGGLPLTLPRSVVLTLPSDLPSMLPLEIDFSS